MRYKQSSDHSAELLRQVLPRIARHGGLYYPVNYAVWYEYLTGGNLPLAEEINRRLENNNLLSQEDIEKLHDVYIAQHQATQVEKMEVGLGGLLGKLGELADKSGGEANEYTRTLKECEAALGSAGDKGNVSEVVATLLSSTSGMRDSAESLRQVLDVTRNEVQELRTELDSLQNEAMTDSLTGLKNRRGFNRAIDVMIATDPDALARCAVMIADIDHFKRVNDSYGHLFGDQVLRTAGNALKSVVKGRDIVARFGGEEFIILLPNTPKTGAYTLAEQLRNTFARGRIRRINSDEYIDSVTISIGVAMPTQGESIDQVIERADRALYRAKQEGRNCVRVAAA